jgi:hypothetical protein
MLFGDKTEGAMRTGAFVPRGGRREGLGNRSRVSGEESEANPKDCPNLAGRTIIPSDSSSKVDFLI